MNIHPTLLTALLLAPLAALHAADVRKPSTPNFIVILSDDQSWVGTSRRMIPGNPETASDYFRTPNIERMAGQGMVFSSGYLIFHQAFDRNAQSAIRWGDFKLVKTWKSGQLELFDLSKDLSEADNLSARLPQKTAELDQTLTTFLSQVNATTDRSRQGKDE